MMDDKDSSLTEDEKIKRSMEPVSSAKGRHDRADIGREEDMAAEAQAAMSTFQDENDPSEKAKGFRRRSHTPPPPSADGGDFKPPRAEHGGSSKEKAVSAAFYNEVNPHADMDDEGF